jgi:hypothetical protein
MSIYLCILDFETTCWNKRQKNIEFTSVEYEKIQKMKLFLLVNFQNMLNKC